MLYALLHTIGLEGKEGETLLYFSTVQNQEVESILHYVGCGPLTVTVTTRIITFLVGDPYKPSFTTVTVRGPYPNYMQMITPPEV